MGNALEAPVTEKDTVRFERAPTALKVSDLWIFGLRAHGSSCDVSSLDSVVYSELTQAAVYMIVSIGCSLSKLNPAVGGNPRGTCTNQPTLLLLRRCCYAAATLRKIDWFELECTASLVRRNPKHDHAPFYCSFVLMQSPRLATMQAWSRWVLIKHKSARVCLKKSYKY